MRLSPRQLEHWHNNGWLHIQEAVSSTLLHAIRVEIESLSDTTNGSHQALHYFEQTHQGMALCRTEQFMTDSELLAMTVNAGSLPQFATTLLGEEVILFKEKINYKQPGGAGFVAHQDAAAYKFIKHHITCLLAVDDMTRENGCLEFAPFYSGRLMPTNGEGCIDEKLANTFNWKPIEARAGDLIYFDSYAPHRSSGNQSKHPRRAIYLTYNAASESDMRGRYYADRAEVMANQDRNKISTIGHFQGKNVTIGNSMNHEQ